MQADKTWENCEWAFPNSDTLMEDPQDAWFWDTQNWTAITTCGYGPECNSRWAEDKYFAVFGIWSGLTRALFQITEDPIDVEWAKSLPGAQILGN